MGKKQKKEDKEEEENMQKRQRMIEALEINNGNSYDFTWALFSFSSIV